jgi:hypothetical protein
MGVRALTNPRISFHCLFLQIAICCLICLLALPGFFWQLPAVAAADPLPSWNEGASKQKILDFVQTTTTAGSPQFVPENERIAVFDQDGTVWPEKPYYIQGVFALDRLKALASQHPEWKKQQPYAGILAGDPQARAQFIIHDIEKILALTHGGISVDEYQKLVKDWLATARHPRYNRLYTQLVFQPMLELMQYMRTKGYRTYVVTGGGQEFFRTFDEQVLGVEPQQVLGSPAQTKLVLRADGRYELVRTTANVWSNDRAVKPVTINLMLGRRPVAAFGNSNGDRQMMEWTQSGKGARLIMLLRHDDPVREYAYGADSKIGNFSAELLKEAESSGWSMISMKNDWKRVFSWE